MNANIVLSVKGRKVKFNPHDKHFKWEITLPIERIEIKCENSHYFERVGYLPPPFSKTLCVTIICDEWNIPQCDVVVLPMINTIFLTGQIRDTLFNTCNCIITIPMSEINQYIKWLRR